MWIFRRPAAAPRRPEPHAAVPGDEPARGCGWYESSHELHSGLQVLEHADVGAVARELPLADWIALFFASGCSAATSLRDDHGLDIKGVNTCVEPGGDGSVSSWACWPAAAAVRI